MMIRAMAALLLGAVACRAESVALAWNRSPDTNVIGYRIYYGGAAGSYTNMIDVGDVTNAVVTGLVEGGTYFFAATAYNVVHLESVYSSEVSYSTPPPLFKVTIEGEPGNIRIGVKSSGIYEIQETADFKHWAVLGVITNSGQVLTDSVPGEVRFYRGLWK
jgi:hypothetical protein